VRKGAGSEATKSKLKRGPRQADQGRAAACTNKNLNANYNAMRTQALPPLVRLEATSELSVQEQLHDALKTHNVKLIDLFREWDDDGNGALDKKELRQAVAALGFEAPRKEIDALFDSIDDDSSGWIEYEELKDALREKNAKRATKEHAKKTALAGKAAAAEEGDVAGKGEEDFEAGMRQNAMERDAADADQDGKLDFGEFCQFVRDREEGEFTEEDLKKRFDALDEDGSGKVDMSEYLLWSLREALSRSAQRVIDVLHAWDEDRSGSVDAKEFTKAIRALGFDVDKEDAEAVFAALDADGSGQLEYKELNTMLRKGVGSDATKSKLKRGQSMQADRGRMAKVTNKNINTNYMANRAQALPPMVRLEAQGETSVQEQLHDALKDHSVKLIDLFREWDDDGNGALDKKELRKAVVALGYDAPRKEVDALFDSIDDDNSGWIEYRSSRRHSRRKM